MKRYDIIDHTADVGITGYGRTLEELFLHMALGMFGLIADVTSIQPMASVPILVQADDLEGLLVAWLKELLYAAERDHLFFMNCRVHQLIPDKPNLCMSGEATGEAIDHDRHQVFREVKAVTYHELGIRREGDLWVARVIFDI